MYSSTIRLVFLGALLVATRAFAGAVEVELAPPLSIERMQGAYWNELATSLAGSEDARDLLTGALVTARPWEAEEPDADRFAHLLARAQRADPTDPLVWWVAASQCSPSGLRCEEAQAAARAHLLRLDPDNALNWLLEAGRAWEAGAQNEAYGALAKAAASGHADDHLIALTLMVAARIEGHPPPPALLRTTDHDAPNLQGFALAGGAAVAAAVAIPSWRALLETCRTTAPPEIDRHCLAVARLLQGGNSLLSAHLGYALERRTLGGADEPAATERRKRELDWMSAQFTRLGDDTEVVASWLASLRQTGSEQRALQDVLAARGIPLQPPANWIGPWTD
ncbi:MAG: hypothetical protein J0H15_11860 [Xanthomonadales bacterium]|nr:hypothetical protein [Xanthomonadales bacterium]